MTSDRTIGSTAWVIEEKLNKPRSRWRAKVVLNSRKEVKQWAEAYNANLEGAQYRPAKYIFVEVI